MRLEEVRGEAADGTVAADGTLDFRGEPARLELGVRAEQLDVTRLPKSWTLPPGTTGRLNGELTFRMPLDGGAGDREGEEQRR